MDYSERAEIPSLITKHKWQVNQKILIVDIDDLGLISFTCLLNLLKVVISRVLGQHEADEPEEARRQRQQRPTSQEARLSGGTLKKHVLVDVAGPVHELCECWPQDECSS